MSNPGTLEYASTNCEVIDYGANRWAESWSFNAMYGGGGSLSHLHPTGGWYHNNYTGYYQNMFYGNTLSGGSFASNTPYLSSPAYTHAPTYGEVEGAYETVTGGKFTYLAGTDPLGSKMAFIEYADGGSWGGPIPFWKISGSYYNELYYFSGLVSYEPSIAMESMKVPNLSAGAFHALMKYGVGTAAIAATSIAGSRYTSGNLFRQGYWRGANGKFYSAALSQKGVKGWVFYKGSANIAMSRVRGIGIFGKGLGYLGLGYTGYAFAQNPTLGTGFNFGVNLASLAFWELGPIYGAGAFMSWASSYERSRIQENIFNNRDPLNNVYNPGLGY